MDVILEKLLLVEYSQPTGFLNVALVKFVQKKNAHSPMLVTPLPIVTLVSSVQ